MLSGDLHEDFKLVLLTFKLRFKISGFRFVGTADASTCMISLRNSRRICKSSDVLGSWDSRCVRFLNNRASICALSLLGRRTYRKVLLLFVEVDQFLGQQLIEQLEILQASLDVAVS